MSEERSLGSIKDAKEVVKDVIGPEGRRTLYITNKTEDNIELIFHNKESEVIEKGITRIYSLVPKDGPFYTSNYECTIRFQNRSLTFWAYGKGAPREDNKFEVTSEGIVFKKETNLSSTRTVDKYLLKKWD